MDWNVVSAIASVVSATAAIVGVPFLASQLHDVRKSQSSQALSSVYARFVELDRYLIDNPQFRRLVYDGDPITTLPEDLRDRVEAVAELVTDIMYQAFTQKMAMREATFTPEVEYIKALFASPEMRKFLVDHRSWYSNQFVSVALGGNGNGA